MGRGTTTTVKKTKPRTIGEQELEEEEEVEEEED